MPDDKVEFELVSPHALVVSEAVEMVVVPGAEGDFGVLPRHSPLISAVRPGVIKVYAGGQVTSSIFVDGGFAEVTTARCTVLAEETLPVDQIDSARVQQELSDARDDLTDAKTDQDREEAEKQIAVAEAKLQAASG